ncbi:outer membrane protein assembly factor BamB family protein [Flammeovirga aprica]|uniref:PQQ-binding-like beta-propeller repeat protein n=1 Tax=Flammeovirga aprica JL-4 TaxID=694437 RepID=A0A7X9XCQ6_9BACT|nr:PQQ-binding-like beta-propeller repeat protein [Flammeovirga aprica]NME72086.1 PQQ-binding-like beta-propeller repeat protein [Flammeovirga aprica JL-4]
MKYYLLILLLNTISICYGQHSNLFVSSGLTDIDKVRKEVQFIPTNQENKLERRAALYRWWRLLSNQGYDLRVFEPIANQLLITSNPEEESTISEGFNCLEKLWTKGEKVEEKQGPKNNNLEEYSKTDWPQYHGTHTMQKGFSIDEGPNQGKVAWKFPKSYGCEISPVIENGKVYLTGEGGDVIGYCLDEKSGAIRWKAIIPKGSYYANSGERKHAIVTKNTVVFMLGHQPYFFNKEDGKPISKSQVLNNKNIALEKLIVRKVGLKHLLLIDPCTGKMHQFYEEKEGITGGGVIKNEKLFYITYRGKLMVIDLKTGDRNTIKIGDGKIVGTPQIEDNIIYIGSNSGAVYAYHILEERLKWTFNVKQVEERSRQLFSQFLIQNDKLYFGSSNKNIYCLEKVSGQLVWQYQTEHWLKSAPVYKNNTLYCATLGGTFYALEEQQNKVVLKWKKKVSDHGFAAELCITEQGVYGVDLNFIVYKVNEQGEKVWQHSVLDGVYIDNQFYASEAKGGQQSSPVVVDNTLYIGGTDGFVNAIDIRTAKELWQFETVGIMASSPTVAYDKVFFGEAYSSTGTYYAVDAKTGRIVWSTQEYGKVWVSATFHDGNIYFGNMDGFFFCVDAASGKKIWSYNTAKDTPLEHLPLETKHQHGFPPGVYCNPVYAEGIIYTGSWSGYYFAFDATTGTLKWRTKTSPENGKGGFPDSAAPVLHKNHLYVQKGGNQIAALNIENGKIDWVWNAPAGYLQNGTVTAYSNKIFGSIVRGVTKLPYDAQIIAFDDVEDGGKELWRYKGGGGLTASVIAKNKLIFGSSAHVHATCLDLNTGELIWKTMLGGTMLEVVPAVYGNKAFFQCKNGYLYAIE